VYLPGLKLLYGSSNDIGRDPQLDRPEGTFNLPEVVAAADRRGLEVENYLAIHTGLTPWRDVRGLAAADPIEPEPAAARREP
jgi:hypothetical protein